MKLINLLIKKNQRLSFNLVNDFKSENKNIEEDLVDILNDFTIDIRRNLLFILPKYC